MKMVERSKVRRHMPNKKTIDVYRNDVQYLDDVVRKTPKGSVSTSDGFHQCIKAYKYCLEHGVVESLNENKEETP